MKTMKNIRKILAVGLIGLVGGLAIAGCTQQMTQADVDRQISVARAADKVANDKAIGDAVNTAVTSAVLAQSAKDAQVIADYKAELAKADAEKASAEAEKVKLQEQLKSKETPLVTPVVVTTATGFEFKLTDDLGLNEYIPADTYTSTDLNKLFDGEIEFDHETYDVRETVEIKENSVKVVTSLTGDEDFGKEPYLVFDQEDSIKYNYVFDDNIPYADITEDVPLEINFLGKNLKIINADANSITIRSGVEMTGKEGMVLSVKGFKDVKIDAISGTKVQVSVDGETASILEDQTKKVNGVDITVDDIFYQNYAGGIQTATLIIGDDVEKTIDSGDEYTEDDETFLWEIATTPGKLERISIVYHPKANDLDDDTPVYKIGQELKFPNDFLVLDFKLDGDYTYNKYSVSFAEVTSDDVAVAKIKAATGKTLKVGNEELDVAYLNDTSVFYKNTDNDWVTKSIVTHPIKIDYRESEYPVSYGGGLLNVAGVSIKTADFVKLGDKEDEAESTDVKVGATSIGTKENDVLLSDGVIVYNVEANADQDEVEIGVPSDTVETVLRVR